MTREEYIEKRNDNRGVDAAIVYAYYTHLCEEQDKNAVTFQEFITNDMQSDRVIELAKEGLDYFDEKYGAMKVSMLENGEEKVMHYM